MRVIDARAGLLTNLEVAALLRQQAEARDAAERALPLPGARRGSSATSTAWQAQQNVSLISEQVLKYLDANCGTLTRLGVVEFLKAVETYKLTRAETLSLVNCRPQSVVEVHLIVEECEERLSQEEVRELLRLCQALEPAPPEAEEAADTAPSEGAT